MFMCVYIYIYIYIYDSRADWKEAPKARAPATQNTERRNP